MIINGTKQESIHIKISEGTMKEVTEETIRRLFDIPTNGYIVGDSIWEETNTTSLSVPVGHKVIRTATADDLAAFLVIERLSAK